MVVGFKGLLGAAIVAATSLGLAEVASAQQTTAPVLTVREAFEREFFRRTGNFYEAERPVLNFGWFIGPVFPEHTIMYDAQDVNRLYNTLLQQQVASTPTIRTADLENPFNTSLQLLPPAVTTTPPAPVPFPVFPPAPVPAPAPGPVPALY